MLLAIAALASPAQTTAPSARTAEARVPSSGSGATARDDRRPDAAFTLDWAGQVIQLGGQWEMGFESRRNFDLDATRARDRRIVDHELKLEARVPLDARTQVFGQIVGLHETRRTQGSERQTRRALERGEFWWQRDRLFDSPWSLQIGRVPLVDRRAWWWDEDLDAVRLRYAREGASADFALARELARKSSQEKGVNIADRGVTRLLGHAQWRYAPRHALDTFAFVHHDASKQPAQGAAFAREDDLDELDRRARWVGIRASGEWRVDEGPRLAYWADLAHVRGRERATSFADGAQGGFVAEGTQARVLRGHAIDLGATGTLALPLRPSVTVAYARGSEGFRQTGLHENKARIGGVKRWQRYGELLQPELANLGVATIGVGARVFDRTSIEFVSHRFRQVRARDALPGARATVDPFGADRDIGREHNLLVAIRESRNVDVVVKASRFKPGVAFPPDRRAPARALELGIAVNF